VRLTNRKAQEVVCAPHLCPKGDAPKGNGPERTLATPPFLVLKLIAAPVVFRPIAGRNRRSVPDGVSPGSAPSCPEHAFIHLDEQRREQEAKEDAAV